MPERMIRMLNQAMNISFAEKVVIAVMFVMMLLLITRH